MIYDSVLIGGDIQSICKEIKQREGEKLRILTADNDNVLEIKKEHGLFELTVLSGDQIIWLHSKKIVLTSYTILEENKVISLYEVLWAAKVKLDAQTRKPWFDEKRETSIKNLYFCA